MTTTSNNYLNPIYQTNVFDNYNGVALVTNGTSAGTGSLLYDGRSILTAAHIFNNQESDYIKVYFGSSDNFDLYNASITFYDDYDSVNSNGDLVILTLDKSPLSSYRRYDLYRDFDEYSKDFTMVGYGNLGTGLRGEYDDNLNNLKLKTTNTFDTDIYDIYLSPITDLSWSPLANSILVADFDDGSLSGDVLGEVVNISGTGTGITEGMIAAGDSGGPAFINDTIAGIASYSISLDTYDFDNQLNSSFGEIGAWQRVSYYQEWIDKTIRSNYVDAPTSSDEIMKTVVETDNYAYFLLEYTSNRSNINDVITLNYTTRDGTAKAGEDYISVSGKVVLYQDESSVVIPVEIIDDNLQENLEFFYLDVTNPSFGSFGSDTDTLTAVRYIANDDMFL